MATTFTVGSGDYIRPWRNVRIQHFPVHVSQTVLKGSAMTIAGAGYENRLILGTDTITAGYVGISAAALTTTATHVAATDTIPVWLATPDAEFIGRTDTTTAANFTYIGANCELELDATNSITCVELASTTYEVVRVLQFLDPVTRKVQATEGDTSVWCVFKFIPGASIYIPTILA
jgi:hypothetical protein